MLKDTEPLTSKPLRQSFILLLLALGSQHGSSREARKEKEKGEKKPSRFAKVKVSEKSPPAHQINTD